MPKAIEYHRFNVDAIWSALASIDSTISSVNKLKNNGASLLFFFLYFSFTFLSDLFCFRSLCQRVVLLNLLDIKVNPNCLLFSERERERENESLKSSREGVVGWCDGAG